MKAGKPAIERRVRRLGTLDRVPTTDASAPVRAPAYMHGEPHGRRNHSANAISVRPPSATQRTSTC